MAVLLDTIYLYELMKDRSATESLLDARRDKILVSVASLWEMRLKYQARRASGKRKSPYDPEAVWLVLRDMRVPVLDVTPEDVTRPLVPPLAHRDPFDELLLSQAQRRNLKLATTDEQLLEHPLATRL